MNALDRVREKFKTPKLHRDRTDRSPSVSFVRVQDKRFEFSQSVSGQRDTLPAGFPFKRHGDDGEWKAEDGVPL